MDIKLICIECGREFVFTEGEQRFYYEKGLVDPKRCKECRNKVPVEKLGARTSNFFENTQTYGPGMSVYGEPIGFGVDYYYEIVTKDNRTFAGTKNNKIILSKGLTKAAKFRKRENAERVKEVIEKNGIVCRIVPKPYYE